MNNKSLQLDDTFRLYEPNEGDRVIESLFGGGISRGCYSRVVIPLISLYLTLKYGKKQTNIRIEADKTCKY